MEIAGRKSFVTLMSLAAILASQFPIPAFAGGEQDLQMKTPTPGQIEAQPTSARSLVLQPPSVAFLIPSTLGSSKRVCNHNGKLDGWSDPPF
jgi:hypothetical protein